MLATPNPRKGKLLGFFVNLATGACAAEFLEFQLTRCGFFVFCGAVILTLALGTL
jgi:hypothetical protein